MTTPKYATMAVQHDRECFAHPYPHAPNVTTRPVLTEVATERHRQDAKWGVQDHPDGTGHGVRLLHTPSLPTWGTLVDRLRKCTEDRAEWGIVSYADVLLEEVAEAMDETAPDRLRAELVQVAAVAVAWIEKIDRQAVTRP